MNPVAENKERGGFKVRAACLVTSVKGEEKMVLAAWVKRLKQHPKAAIKCGSPPPTQHRTSRRRAERHRKKGILQARHQRSATYCVFYWQKRRIAFAVNKKAVLVKYMSAMSTGNVRK